MVVDLSEGLVDVAMVVVLFTAAVVPGILGVVAFAVDKGLVVVESTAEVRALVTVTGAAAFVDGVTFAGVGTSAGGAVVGVVTTAESTFTVVGGPLVVPFRVVLMFLVPFPVAILAPIVPAPIVPAANVPAANVPVAVFAPNVPTAVFPATDPVSGLLSLPGTAGPLSLVLCFDPESLSLPFFLLGFFMFLTTFPVDLTGARLLFIGMVAILGFGNTSVTVCRDAVDVSGSPTATSVRVTVSVVVFRSGVVILSVVDGSQRLLHLHGLLFSIGRSDGCQQIYEKKQKIQYIISTHD